MKGNPKVIDILNKGLTIELTAINQYFIQAKMCKAWGFNKLAKKQYEESMEEMKHAESLIDRILFLEGTPNVRYGELQVGGNIQKHFENDLKLETLSVKQYNQGVEAVTKLGDTGSRDLLAKLLTSSEEHVDWLEAQLNVIKEIGLENYLTLQVGEEA